MVLHLEENPDTRKNIQLLNYVYKQSDNLEFSKTIEKFLRLYEYLKENKHSYMYPKDICKDILYNGKPFFQESHCEILYEMLAMKGGGEKFNTLSRILLGWMYKLSPKYIEVSLDQIIPLFQKYINVLFQPGTKERNLFNLSIKVIYIVINEELNDLKNSNEESGFFSLVGHYILVLIYSLFLIFLNILHSKQGDWRNLFIETFYILPFLDETLMKLSSNIEPHLETYDIIRSKIIDTLKKDNLSEDAELLETHLPSLVSDIPYKYPLDTPVQLPRLIDKLKQLVKNPDIYENLEMLIKKYAATLTPKKEDNIQKQKEIIGGLKRFTRGHLIKRKWGTRRKSEQD
jgi:hypothetical protein